MSSNRIGRINDEIQKELSALLRTVKDPRVTDCMLTITHVDTTSDLRYARIYVSALNCPDEKGLLKGLKSAAGYLRHELGSRIDLRYTPELQFFVDDSIVRGTTSRQIVVLLREAGAVQVHLRISAPPFIAPCYFGTDIPDSEHLIAHDRSPEEICALTGADSLGFLPLKVLHQIAPDAGCGFCDGCFTGNYPIRL